MGEELQTVLVTRVPKYVHWINETHRKNWNANWCSNSRTTDKPAQLEIVDQQSIIGLLKPERTTQILKYIAAWQDVLAAGHDGDSASARSANRKVHALRKASTQPARRTKSPMALIRDHRELHTAMQTKGERHGKRTLTKSSQARLQEMANRNSM